jgi:large subunit ribosomal protein L24
MLPTFWDADGGAGVLIPLRVPMRVPDFFRSLDPNQPTVLFREMPIHYDDVRLVVPLLKPETNKLQDTVVAKIAMSNVYFDKTEGVAEWSRYIAGTTTEIPWPEKEPEKEYFDQPGDTRIMHVETSTYIPKLLEPPFPVSVMDELRNKYSKFRMRHEPAYIADIERRERRKLAKTGVKISTPVQELNKSLRQEKKARGPPVMTESIMEQIGRVMAQNKPELLEKVQHRDVGVD